MLTSYAIDGTLPHYYSLTRLANRSFSIDWARLQNDGRQDCLFLQRLWVVFFIGGNEDGLEELQLSLSGCRIHFFSCIYWSIATRPFSSPFLSFETSLFHPASPTCGKKEKLGHQRPFVVDLSNAISSSQMVICKSNKCKGNSKPSQSCPAFFAQWHREHNSSLGACSQLCKCFLLIQKPVIRLESWRKTNTYVATPPATSLTSSRLWTIWIKIGNFFESAS